MYVGGLQGLSGFGAITAYPIVKTFQTVLNIWLKTNGKTRLVMDGKYGAKTHAAMLDYADAARGRDPQIPARALLDTNGPAMFGSPLLSSMSFSLDEALAIQQAFTEYKVTVTDASEDVAQAHAEAVEETILPEFGPATDGSTTTVDVFPVAEQAGMGTLGYVLIGVVGVTAAYYGYKYATGKKTRKSHARGYAGLGCLCGRR